MSGGRAGWSGGGGGWSGRGGAWSGGGGPSPDRVTAQLCVCVRVYMRACRSQSGSGCCISTHVVAGGATCVGAHGVHQPPHSNRGSCIPAFGSPIPNLSLPCPAACLSAYRVGCVFVCLRRRAARVELARATGGGPPKKGQGKRAKK